MVRGTLVLPFKIQIEQGEPASDQIVAAVKRSLISGALKSGDTFPSVREISKALRINPKTAQKAAAILIGEDILETRPGLGSLISDRWENGHVKKQQLVRRMIDELAVESRICGVSLNELKQELEMKWKELEA